MLEIQKNFTISGDVYVIPPNVDNQIALLYFDHPELLDIIEISRRVHIICLRKEKGILIKVFNGKITRLKEMGISDEIIDTMSYKEIIALKKKS